MRIISYNVNGIRAAMNKGLIDWLKTDPGDIICLQETKAHKDNVDYKQFTNLDYYDYWFSAQKKGYSGVAVFTKIKPDNVVYGTGHQVSDEEGRVMQLDFGDVRLINAYFPSGTTGDMRQQYKYEWLDEFFIYLSTLREKHPKLILCGDYNIAHKEIDIHDPKGNKNSSGFLPEERTWMDKFMDSGWVDTFREFHPEPHRYSWWSQRFPAVRLQNKGWRIDYINATEPLRKQLKGADIYPDVKHSDHCPVYLELTK
ncbi:exodeoxyribonuclease III [Pseudoflavitalea sp. X16]|uniref:exodeoxyribonuclease III n=1 Tax=Paraflavitalea devenefica TaxID=2716334 RepID=UPI001420264F|nr:exodeoxyribonuclease III [Paraflavitalea devenefica]NII24827.1 exodeoxyribonuclease III [Paraflavitalea devenefica]